jgi:hypothetical protein
MSIRLGTPLSSTALRCSNQSWWIANLLGSYLAPNDRWSPPMPGELPPDPSPSFCGSYQHGLLEFPSDINYNTAVVEIADQVLC